MREMEQTLWREGDLYRKQQAQKKPRVADDLAKQAMVNVCEAGHVPMLQVHDELAFSVESKDQARELADIMEQAVPLQVPNKCDMDYGPSWGEGGEID